MLIMTIHSSLAMKTCDHCGTNCAKRVPCMVRGRVAMVGTGCAKHFKRASRRDMSNGYGGSGHPPIHGPITIAGYGPKEPTPITEAEFRNKFFNKKCNNPILLATYKALFSYRGSAVLLIDVYVGGTPDKACSIVADVYDPYTCQIIDHIQLIYKKHPAYPNPIVAQDAIPGDSDYSIVIQKMLDEYPQWDPIAKYCPISHAAPIGPGRHGPYPGPGAKSIGRLIGASATFIKKISSMNGDARLYKLDPPMTVSKITGDVDVTYVVVSGIGTSGIGTMGFLIQAPETLIFESDSSGKVTNWMDLYGSFQGSIDHEMALNNAGYKVVP